MKLSQIVAAISTGYAATTAINSPAVVADSSKDIKYIGFERNGIELFLNIKYGQDTGGENRFKPPRPYYPEPGSTIEALSAGPACPQSLGTWNQPLTLLNVTEISEDCLNLNVARPKDAKNLPVMVWIHGGE
jgi:carboxylesterase type B